MCGFGDKDRRPATPPPIVQLIIKDLQGNEISVDSIDVSFFVLLTDLYSADGSQEMNTVVHPAMTAAAALVAYERQERDRSDRKGRRESNSHRTLTTTTTRNLIGSLVANAAKLMGLPEPKLVVDGDSTSSTGDNEKTPTVTEEGKWGIYFVLQDLSVRTEGKFKLKFSFVDLQSEEGLNMVNTGVSQVRAEIFSDRFTVYSAKNFPGMAESTDLSRCFARQGIKIHVRRDTTRRQLSQSDEVPVPNDADDDADDDDETNPVASEL